MITLPSSNSPAKKSFLLGLILAFTLQGLACSSPTQGKTEPQAQPKVQPKAEPQTPPQMAPKLVYPADVLVGTDIKKLSSFRFSDATPQAGTYSSENGGSTTDLTLRMAGKTLEVTRVFREPGERPRSKVYANLERTTEGIYQSKDALLRVIDNGSGLLLLERASGLESIPNSFWTLFELKKKTL